MTASINPSALPSVFDGFQFRDRPSLGDYIGNLATNLRKQQYLDLQTMYQKEKLADIEREKAKREQVAQIMGGLAQPLEQPGLTGDSPAVMPGEASAPPSQAAQQAQQFRNVAYKLSGAGAKPQAKMFMDRADALDKQVLKEQEAQQKASIRKQDKLLDVVLNKPDMLEAVAPILGVSSQETEDLRRRINIVEGKMYTPVTVTLGGRKYHVFKTHGGVLKASDAEWQWMNDYAKVHGLSMNGEQPGDFMKIWEAKKAEFDTEKSGGMPQLVDLAGGGRGWAQRGSAAPPTPIQGAMGSADRYGQQEEGRKRTSTLKEQGAFRKDMKKQFQQVLGLDNPESKQSLVNKLRRTLERKRTADTLLQRVRDKKDVSVEKVMALYTFIQQLDDSTVREGERALLDGQYKVMDTVRSWLSTKAQGRGQLPEAEALAFVRAADLVIRGRLMYLPHVMNDAFGAVMDTYVDYRPTDAAKWAKRYRMPSIVDRAFKVVGDDKLRQEYMGALSPELKGDGKTLYDDPLAPPTPNTPASGTPQLQPPGAVNLTGDNEFDPTIGF